MQKGAFWSLLEQSWAWNESHMLGAKGMDEIEDLKRLGFLINEGFLIGKKDSNRRIPNRRRIPNSKKDS